MHDDIVTIGPCPMLQRKTQEELEVMHYANQVASAAHVQVQSPVL
jgi:Xaa-Pro aminopeptidase